MGTTIPESKFTELEGLDAISKTVHQMKCLFREISKDDCGLDGEIEVLRKKTSGPGYETSGGIIKVQAKSGASYVKSDTHDSFRTPVEKKHLEQWYESNFPVLFIVYHPGEKRLYWKEVKSFVRSTPRVWQPPHYIEFQKATDVFDQSTYAGLTRAANASPPRVSTTAKERLYSNLFLVQKSPRTIFHAPTEYSSLDEIRDVHAGSLPPCCVVEKRLFSFANPRHPGSSLREYCAFEETEPLHSWEWADSTERQHDYVFLLNQLFGKHLSRCGLKYNRDYKRNYFPREDDESKEFRRFWFNVRTKREAPSRIVAKYYKYGRDEFWRHFAMVFSFEKIGTAWYLQLEPKYFFTFDGETPFDNEKVGPYTTRIKAVEHNPQVLNHVLFLADSLSQGRPAIDISLFHKRIMVIEKEPVTCLVQFAIPDDPAIYEEPPTDGQMDLMPKNLLLSKYGLEDDPEDEY